MLGYIEYQESVRAYAYLILSSQVFARSGIVGNTAGALTAQLAFIVVQHMSHMQHIR